MSWLQAFFEKLSLRKTIAVALVIGLAVPVGVSAWLNLKERRTSLLERLNEEHARIVEVLAFGMRTPLWEIRPEAGRSLIDALMLDERVTAITVTSPLVPRFIATETPERRQGETLLLERPVRHNDEEIGRVRVEMDTGLLEARLAEQWIPILWTALLQFANGIIIIFALLRFKVLAPLQRLVKQSEALAGGELHQPLRWRRSDELGLLGRSFERMRQSLCELVSDLERRNQELRERETELQNQASIMRTILDNMTDGITLVDENLYLIAWNERLIDIMGLPRQLFYEGVSTEELIRFDLAQGGHDPVDRETVVRALRKTYQPGHSSSTRYRTARNRIIDIHRRPMPDGGFVNTFTDVTEQVEAQHEADETRLMLEAIMDAVPAGLHVKDLELRYRLANRQFLEWLGRRREDVLGKSSHDVFDSVEVCRLAETRDRQVIATGEPSPFEEMPFLTRGGLVTTWTTKVPLRDARGKVSHVLTVELDISERKSAEAELARHREALHQSEKLTALGSLLAGVAHELNNPLSVVVGRAIMLEEQLSETRAAKSIAKIRAAAERCARIVKTFLAMARRQEPMRVSAHLEQIINSALEMVAYGLRAAGVRVELELAPNLPEINADPDQLTQVFTNLLVNAQHALENAPEPRRLMISAQCDDASKTLRIRIADNGPGIPPELRSRVFEPFFTTKPVGEGTGVGLSVSHGIIQSHGGAISVSTREGGGTAFEIQLPIETAVQPAAANSPPSVSDRIGRQILIVDDEPEVAQVLGDILAGAGHRVATVGSGRLALERLSEQRFDLMLSDLRMPDLDGPGLYAALPTVDPQLCERTVFVTGDTLSVAAKRFLEECQRPVIEKPFVPDEVRRVVDEALTSAQL